MATSGGLTGSPLTFTATGTAGAATQMAVNAGNNQSATVSSPVATAPSVLVRDVNGNAVTGTVVTFAVTGGGGSTSPASGGTVTTNGSGIAALTSWTLGSSAAANTLTAAVGGLSGSPVTCTATGTAGTATSFLANSATSQTATVGAAVAAPAVLGRDASNNPVAGFSVTFTLTAAGGTGAAAGAISPSSAATVVSNSSGVASLSTWTLGLRAGSANTVVASGAGIGSPVTFSGTSTASTAQDIVANRATSQTGTVGTTVTAPSVTVRDANNNPVQGVVVTFTTTAGNGTTSPVTGSTVTTDASGVAALPTWPFGATAGPNPRHRGAPARRHRP